MWLYCRLLIFLFILSLSIPSSLWATRFFVEDFEDGDYTDTMGSPAGEDWCVRFATSAVVTNAPHGGSRSLRGNSYEGANDPITGKPGENNPGLFMGYLVPSCGSAIPNWQNYFSTELWIRFWIRFDSGIDNTTTAPKLVYFVVPGGYVYVNQWPNSLQTYGTGFAGPSEGSHYAGGMGQSIDGQWHRYTIRLRIGQDFTVWKDGVLATGHPRAWTGGKPSRMAWMYNHPTAVSTYGWQLDDIEHFDSDPGTSTDNFYVSSSGNDSWAGTQAAPFRTFARGVSELAPGKTLYLQRGSSWNEQLNIPISGTSSQHVVIGAYGSGADPIIDAQYTRDYCINFEGYDYVDVSDIECRNGQAWGIRGWNADHITLSRMTTDACRNAGAYFGSVNFLSIVDSTFKNSPNGHGIYYSGDDISILRNVLSGNYQNGLHDNVEPGDNSRSERIEIANNTFTDNRWSGMYLYGSEAPYIHHNVIEGSRGYCIGLGFELGYESLGAHNAVIYSNTCDMDYADGRPCFYVRENNSITNLYDNICYVPNLGRFINVEVGGVISGSDYNLYYGPSLTTKFTYGGSDYATFSAWQALGYDTNSNEGDPGFVDRVAGDYTPTGIACVMSTTGYNVGAIECDLQPPDAPTELSIVGRILVWEPSSAIGLAGYRVYASRISGSYNFGVDHAIKSVPMYETGTTVDIGGGVWYLVVTAYTSSGAESLASPEVSLVQADNSKQLIRKLAR